MSGSVSRLNGIEFTRKKLEKSGKGEISTRKISPTAEGTVNEDISSTPCPGQEVGEGGRVCSGPSQPLIKK